MRLMSTPSSSAVSESSAMVRSPRPIRVLVEQQRQAPDQPDRAEQADELRHADDETADAPIGAGEQARHALQVGAPIDDGQILEQDAETPSSSPAARIRSAMRIQRQVKRSTTSEAAAPTTSAPPAASGHGMPGAHQRPGRHAADHEQAGDAEVEEFQDADAQRQRDGDHRVDGAEHQAVDDLLRENGLAPRPTSSRERRQTPLRRSTAGSVPCQLKCSRMLLLDKLGH